MPIAYLPANRPLKTRNKRIITNIIIPQGFTVVIPMGKGGVWGGIGKRVFPIAIGIALCTLRFRRYYLDFSFQIFKTPHQADGEFS
jgi:hypothetical protein